MSPATIIEDRKIVQPPDVWPPDDGDGGGGGGGNNGRGGSPHEGGIPVSAGRLAVIFLCGSIVMLFSGALSALVIFRDQAGGWPPHNYPQVGPALWFSTGLIAASSLMGIVAMRQARPELRGRFRLLLGLTLALGLGFCLSQALLWSRISASKLTTISSSNFNALFYMITGLHVIHVLGGVFYLTRCVWRAGSTSDFPALRQASANCMIYWHFIGLVWLALFAFLHP